MGQHEEIQDMDLQGTDAPAVDAAGENDADLQAYADMVHDESVEMNNTKVYNALKIVSFILDNCLDYDKALIANVFEARTKVNTDEWTPEAEAKFMDTYGKLVKLIQPVSVSSIATMTAAEKQALSGVIFGKERREKRKRNSTIAYSAITFLLLMVLLGVQVYYYLGSTRINNITSAKEKLEANMARQNEVRVILSKDEDNVTYNIELEELMDRASELNNEIQSNILLLEPWAKFLSKITFDIRGRDVNTQEKEYVAANVGVIQEARGYALILGIYVLPLLYGIIGAFTFVLMEMKTDFHVHALDKEADLKYVFRTLLGAVAGLSVGLFWSDIENAQVAGFTSLSLSPMLLAFLGGFCVEYLLEFVEKIVKLFFSSFFAKQEKKAEASADESKDQKPQPPAEAKAQARASSTKK